MLIYCQSHQLSKYTSQIGIYMQFAHPHNLKLETGDILSQYKVYKKKPIEINYVADFL
jgi:hypothetical protein